METDKTYKTTPLKKENENITSHLKIHLIKKKNYKNANGVAWHQEEN